MYRDHLNIVQVLAISHHRQQPAASSLVEFGPEVQRLGLTHLAISVGSERTVDELIQRLSDDGIAIADGPRRTGDRYYESVVIDPAGNRIEICS